MSTLKHHSLQYRMATAEEYLAACATKQVPYQRFIHDRRLSVNVSTLFRWVARLEKVKEAGVSYGEEILGGGLSQIELGNLLGLADMHLDESRKRRGKKTVAAVIAMFRQHCRGQGVSIKLSDGELRRIIREKICIKLQLDDEGNAAYARQTADLLDTAQERLERVQVDACELKGPFLTVEGIKTSKVFVLVAICVATKMIVNTSYHFAAPHGSDAARLILGIVEGNGGAVNCSGGPIGCVQVDNGIFRSDVLRDFLSRLGIDVRPNQPGFPQQNGVVEKAIGDMKRGVVFEVENELSTRMLKTVVAGEEVVSEHNLATTIDRVVADLNEGRRRDESPRERWERTPPLQNAPRDFAVRLRRNRYIIHRRISLDGCRVQFDRTLVACLKRRTNAPAERCFVKEMLTPSRRLELWCTTLKGDEFLESTLKLVSESWAERCLEPPGQAAQMELFENDSEGARKILKSETSNWKL
jgi:transposase InsO family protein